MNLNHNFNLLLNYKTIILYKVLTKIYLMSVSEGLKKLSYKSFYVKLNKIDEFGIKTTQPEDLQIKIKIQPWTHIKELKQKIANVHGVSLKNIKLFFSNIELFDELTMLDYKIVEKKNPEINYQIQNKQNDFNIRIYGTFPCSLNLQKIIEEINNGFLIGLKPKFLEDGTSGTYLMRNVNKETIAIFKPFDEEPFAPNNQKGYVNKFGSETFRKGILSGEGSIREFAAYFLDNKKKFDVPITTFVEVSHPSFNKFNMNLIEMENNNFDKIKGSMVYNFLKENIVSSYYNFSNNDDIDNFDFTSSKKYNFIPKKFGSLQKFIKSTDVAANFSFSLYSVEQVHKIAVLDLRICNCDRNEENILVIKKKNKKDGKNYYKLIPIDHSLSFPDCLKIIDYELCWTGWDQVNIPFSKEMKDYIKSIDIISDMEKLSKLIKLREDCWKMFRVTNTVLKICADYNLTLSEISNILYQTDYKHETPSHIEKIIEKVDYLCSDLRIDKRLRIFSVNEKRKKSEENEDNNNKNFKRGNKKKTSLLQRTPSLSKLLEVENNNDDEDEYIGLGKKIKKKKSRSKNNSVHNDIVFDTPYNEMYFYHFETFVIELIRKIYPEKAKIRESQNEENNN